MFSFTFAQAETETSAGITPSSRFYFIDNLGEWLSIKLTFNPIKKVEKKLQNASERLAELKALKDEGSLDKENAEELKDRYQKLSDDVEASVKDLKAKGKDISALVKKMEDLTARHIAVLEKVLEKAPEQAKDALEKVLEKAEQGHEKAIEAIQKEVEDGNIKKEELKEDVRMKFKEMKEKKAGEKLEELNLEEDQRGIEESMKELGNSNGTGEIEKGLEEAEKSAR